MSWARSSHVRRGITLMETVIGSLLVGGVLASTIQLLGPTVRATALADRRVVAAAIAGTMLDEIAAHPFEDPADATDAVGPESDEVTGSRKAFDDVDDYHGWSGSVLEADGSAVDGLGSGWTVQVAVQHVRPSDPSIVQAARSGVKRVVVTVSHGGVLLAERSLLRTSAFEHPRGAP